MMPQLYNDPVAKLLTYRRFTFRDMSKPWPDYRKLGLTHEHVPELIRMATDPDLDASPSKSLRVWAPLHAWRALAQLRAVEAIQPLLLRLEQNEDDDWLHNDVRRIFAMIGPSAIPALEAFLGDAGGGVRGSLSVPECLVEIARDHPGEHDRCVSVLVRRLGTFATSDPELNALVISGLIDLGATDAIGLIRQAFAENRVELQVAGDAEDVEMEMGLRTERSTPPARLGLLKHGFGSDDVAIGGIEDEMDGPASLPASWNVPVRRAPKVGRNDPCPCGSGKKFKKCCMD